MLEIGVVRIGQGIGEIQPVTATAVASGLVLSAPRLLYAMARDRQMPRFLARINDRHKVPANATANSDSEVFSTDWRGRASLSVG